MTVKENPKALGRGLKALIKDRPSQEGNGDGLTEAEVKAQNMEFYGSLMKQYVQVGEGDNNTEELLQRIRQHLNIGEEEHQHLVQTLRRRDVIDPKVSQEELKRAQMEMKQELKQLFMEFKDDGPVPNVNGANGSGMGAQTPVQSIPLPERTAELVKGGSAPITVPPPTSESGQEQTALAKRRVRRLVIPKDLDKRAGIISEGETHGKTRLDWLDEGEAKPIPMPPMDRRAPETVNDVGKGAETIPERPVENGDMFEDLGEVPESGGAVQAINVVKGSEVLREMLDDEGLSAVKPLVKGELKQELERAERGPSAQSPPSMEDSLMSLKLLMEEERFEEALAMSDRLLSKGSDAASLLNERGFILFNMGRVDESLSTYRQLLEMDPGSVEAMVNYAQVLSTKGQLDEALRYLDMAVKKDPYSEDAWNNKAVVLSRFGRLREALVCLDEAMRINERSVVTLFNTGVILERMGEFGPAIEAYSSILEMEPGNSMAKEGYESCRRQLGY